MIVHRHLAEVHGHLEDQVLKALWRVARGRDSLLLLGGQASLAHVTNVEHFLQVDAKEVEHSGSWNLVLDVGQNVELQRLDVLNRKLLVRNLLVDHLHFQGVNVFVLARDEHASHTDDVQVRNLTPLRLILEVAIQEAHCEEKGLVIALEVSEHLDHPVNHASSQRRRDLVPHQTIGGQVLQLELAHVAHDALPVLVVHIDVLALDLVGLLTGEVGGGVGLGEISQHHVVVYHVAVADVHACGLKGALTQVAPLLDCVRVSVILETRVHELVRVARNLSLRLHSFHLVLRVFESRVGSHDIAGVDHDSVGCVSVLQLADCSVRLRHHFALGVLERSDSIAIVLFVSEHLSFTKNGTCPDRCILDDDLVSHGHLRGRHGGGWLHAHRFLLVKGWLLRVDCCNCGQIVRAIQHVFHRGHPCVRHALT